MIRPIKLKTNQRSKKLVVHFTLLVVVYFIGGCLSIGMDGVDY